MVLQKRRRREGIDTDPASINALRQEVEELREERAKPREGNEGNEEMKLAKFGAESQTPQEKDKEVKLPTEVWAIIAKKVNKNDVCSFALVSKQLREAQVMAGRKLVTRPVWKYGYGYSFDSVTEDWCAYWSRKFIEDHTDPKVIKRVLYFAAYQGYLQVFEKYWSQGPQEKLSKLWDENACGWAAYGGHLEMIKWLRAKGCPWGTTTSSWAAEGGHLDMLQWMRAQDPPCPWDSDVYLFAASKGHLEVLRWARSQGCPWDEYAPSAAARHGHLEVLQWMRAQDPPCPWDSDVCYNAAFGGHLEVLRWARSQGCPWDEDLFPHQQATCAAAEGGHLKVLKWLIKEGCPYDKRECRRYAEYGGEQARNVLEWLDE